MKTYGVGLVCPSTVKLNFGVKYACEKSREN
jgi:hypothetical protein